MKLFLRLVLVAAFLLAQTAGIAHQAWHDTAAHHDGKAPAKTQLCDFHTALGSVLGALGNAHPAPEAVVQTVSRISTAEFRAARFSLLASRSRGPPALL